MNNCLFYVQPKVPAEDEYTTEEINTKVYDPLYGGEVKGFEIVSLPIKYAVYDVKCDKNGYPLFLIYKDNQWVYKSAKHYVPI